MRIIKRTTEESAEVLPYQRVEDIRETIEILPD